MAISRISRLLVLGLMGGGVAFADSITIKGVAYEDVLVRRGVSRYYVQVPSDGTVVSAASSDVDPATVHIVKNKAYRTRLLSAWKSNSQKRKQGRPEDSESAKPDGKGPSQASGTAAPGSASGGQRPAPVRIGRGKPKSGGQGAKVQNPRGKSGIPVLTNAKNREANRKHARPLFVNRSGVVLFTNRPEKYRAKAEYIEVAINYDQVAVPKQFQQMHSPADYTSGSIAELVRYYAAFYGIEEPLLHAVIRAESNYDPEAVSTAGARGLMQLMPGTAAEMGVTDIFDPAQNIAGGAQYLAQLLDLFDGELDLALAGYNAGPANVIKYGGIPPFKETRDYVPRVKRFRDDFRRLDAGPAYEAKAAPYDVAYLPDEPAAESESFVLRFYNGLTQRATEIVDGGDYYQVQFEGRLTRVRKSDVATITGPGQS